MRIRTVLNRLVNFKGFVVVNEAFVEIEGADCIEIELRPRANGKPVCSQCNRKGSVYDHLTERRFQFPALWGVPVLLVYCMRRVNCPSCGVKVEAVPWGIGKSPVSKMLALQLAHWARLLSWQDVCRQFQVNWFQVYESVRYIVEWGLAHRDLSAVEALGIDEVQYGKGKKYVTVVYQLCGDVRRLLYVGRRRETQTLKKFFDEQGATWCGAINYVCTDMYRAYLKAIRENLPTATHVLDRFHIVKLLNEAVDQVRRNENTALRTQGIELLKGMRYVFLKRPENLTAHQRERLQAMMNKTSLKTIRAWRWKEKFQLFWEYDNPALALQYLKKWQRGAMRSRLAPLKKFVKTIRRHEALIMNWFEAKKRYSNGAVEGMNRKMNLVTRKSYGYKSFEIMKIALFHTLGHLPEPEVTHRF